MMNGKAYPRNGVAVTGPVDASAAETSDLYGEYEQQLASDLTALLQAVPRQGQDREKVASSAVEPEFMGASRSADDPSKTVPFVPAVRPYNDFVDDGSRPPIPTGWREGAEAESRSTHRQIKFGLAGFSLGLALVVPVVLALTGRLDGIIGSGSDPRPVTSIEPVPVAAAVAAAVESPAPTGPVSSGPPIAGEIRATPPQAEERPPAKPELAAAHPAPAQLLQDPSVTADAPRDAQRERRDRDDTATPPLQALAERAAPAAPQPVDPVAGLVATGVRHISEGDVAAAREVFTRAAASGHPEATMALAETYDPNMLAAWGARDIRADAAVARSLYAKALEAGVEKARMRLEALN